MPLTPINAINVHDYAPVVGGVPQIGLGGDDRAAIQAAINAAITLSWNSTYLYYYSSPRLYFPPGKYKIGGTLTMGGAQISLSVIGDDAVIAPYEGFNHDTFALTTEYAFNLKIKGLHFVGFSKTVSINYPQNNLNTSQFLMEECVFIDNGEALRLFGQSTIAGVSRCKFFNNTVAINIPGGDKITVSDCWIESGVMSDTVVGEVVTETHPAQILNYGALTVLGCVLVPAPPVNATEPAWINNYGSVTVKDTRQGGEIGSFTLVNNFAPVQRDFTAVIVKDCQCYAVYGNVYDPATGQPVHLQPSILRYVTKIPNQTVISNNRGLIDSRLVEFSYHHHGDNTALINTTIAGSAVGVVVIDSAYVVVEVINNTRGTLYGNKKSFVPEELFPFVRDEASLWPFNRRSNALEVIVANDPEVDGFILFKAEFDAGFNETYLVNYTGNPNVAGSGGYRGNFVGLLRSNGFWTGTQTAQSLILEPIFNQIGDPSPTSYPTGTFTIETYWDDSGTEHLLTPNANRNFYLKISGRSGGAWIDKIKITPLDSL